MSRDTLTKSTIASELSLDEWFALPENQAQQ